MAADAPTIIPHSPFNAKSDAEGLQKALKGLGTDEKALIKILPNRTWKQRHEISAAYQEKYKKNLLDDVKSDTSGEFYRVLQALLRAPEVNDAKALNHAMKGVGTDEDTLMEIIFTRSSQELQNISKAYFDLYKKTLAAAITDDTSSDFRDLLLAIVTGNRKDEGPMADDAAVHDDAKALYEAGPKRLGTTMKTYIDIFSTRSFAQLRRIFPVFKGIAKMDIEDAVKSEMSGDTAKSFTVLVHVIKDKESYFSGQIVKATKGMGTKNQKLIRILVSRAEKDLAGIKSTYQKLSKSSLESVIQAETSSDYRDVLLEIVRSRT